MRRTAYYCPALVSACLNPLDRRNKARDGGQRLKIGMICMAHQYSVLLEVKKFMPRRKWPTMGVRLMGRPRTAPRQSWRKDIVAQGLKGVPDGSLVDVTPAPGATYTRDTWPPRGRGRGESIYSVRRMQAKLRAVEVVRLRCAGCTYAQIARKLGFADGSGAYRAWRRTLDRIDWDQDRRAELRERKWG